MIGFDEKTKNYRLIFYIWLKISLLILLICLKKAQNTFSDETHNLLNQKHFLLPLK